MLACSRSGVGAKVDEHSSRDRVAQRMTLASRLTSIGVVARIAALRRAGGDDSVFLFAAALVGIVLLFVYFDGCGVNSALISITLVLCVVVTATQLLISRDGNLLSSAVVCAYVSRAARRAPRWFGLR